MICPYMGSTRNICRYFGNGPIAGSALNRVPLPGYPINFSCLRTLEQ